MMKNLRIFFGILMLATLLASCIKDRQFPFAVYNLPGTPDLGTRQPIHYWNFNGSNLLLATTSIGGASLSYTGGGAYDAVNPGSSINARNGDAAGAGLRLRNPAGTFILNMPTINYKDIIFSFATQRSNSGPQQNIISYSIDGSNFITDSLRPNIHQEDTVWQSFYYDFSSIKRANDNPFFKIKISFAVNDTGTSGNDRYDNISLDGNIIAPVPPPTPEIVHYWNFNDPAALLNESAGIGSSSLNYTGDFDQYSTGSAVNAQNGDPAGGALRLRNIASTFNYGTFTISAPTTNFKNLSFSLEVQSSGNGPQTNTVTYTTDGTTYISTGLAGNVYAPGTGTAYNLINLDFSSIPAANNNPNFKIKIDFSDGSTSTTGNDRFDNLLLKGVHL